MIDLHLHLDGSIAPRDMLPLARLSGVTLPVEKAEALAESMTFSGRGTLNDYLKKFDLPLSVLQTEEAVEYAVQALGDRLYELGYEYAEIRFAPQLHTRKGTNEREIVEAALRGRQGSRTPINLILCCMRGAARENNLRTVELAAAYRDKGVVGVDLAGAEALYPTEGYREVFSLAMKCSLNITIHAGEAAGEDSVRAALDFGAKRIGHGVAAASSESLMDRLARGKIAIECCPTSNLQTGAVRSLSNHPIKTFFDHGIPVLLCSDNMTVSDTDVSHEWERVRALFSSEEDFSRLTANARACRFR